MNASLNASQVALASHAALPKHLRLSAQEELANCVTHGFGLVLAIVAGFMMADAMGAADVWRVAGCSIYVTSLIGVYAMSTLSHSFEAPRLRTLFRALDQGTIYLLIAGTYTPFSLAYLHSAPWWILLAAVWTVAIYGFVSKTLFAHRVENVNMWPCILVGALPFAAIPTLVGMLPIAALYWMMAGCGAYVLGLAFWLNDSKVRHFHAVWHLLVITGSAVHFVGIMKFVVLA
jgi:hemolysin III